MAKKVEIPAAPPVEILQEDFTKQIDQILLQSEQLKVILVQALIQMAKDANLDHVLYLAKAAGLQPHPEKPGVFIPYVAPKETKRAAKKA